MEDWVGWWEMRIDGYWMDHGIVMSLINLGKYRGKTTAEGAKVWKEELI
jgi:hypothetical protein